MTESRRSVLILDFGSQVTQLIARRVREAGVYCEIAPFNSFDGGTGSLLTGDGWEHAEGDGGGADRGSYAWAIKEEAVLYYEQPPAKLLDFYARCKPFTYAGASAQRVDLVLDGKVVGGANLAKGWQEIRIPLRKGGAPRNPVIWIDPHRNRTRLSLQSIAKQGELHIPKAILHDGA